MQSVLITGGAGFIGQNLVHAWRAARPADRLVVIDAMTYAADLRSLEPLIVDGSIAFVKGDINDAALIRYLFDEHRFTRVAHLAAESHVDRSIDAPEAFLQTNVFGTFNLLKTAQDRLSVRPSQAAQGRLGQQLFAQSRICAGTGTGIVSRVLVHDGARGSAKRCRLRPLLSSGDFLLW